MFSSIQKEKAERFLKYHRDKEILVLLNSWDIGSSKLIEACGYKAIATTSMGIAASLGYPDCQIIQLSEMIEVITGIVNAVQAPVTVDSELQDLGVARLSLGSGLMKATLALIKKVAEELSEKGTYNILLDTLTPFPDAAIAYKMTIGLN